jgi:outer membrane protein assembly factor BamB
MDGSPSRDSGPAERDGGSGGIAEFRTPLLVLTALVGLLFLFGSWLLLRSPDDVRNEDAGFVVDERPGKPAARPAEKKRIAWPMFGFDRARTRNLQVTGVRPPFKTLWKYEAGVLLEFPPVYARGRLYLIDNDARLKSLDPDTGKVLWERRIGRLNASSPAFHRGFLYVVNLEPGQVLKIRARTGKTVWKRSLPGRSESSPLVRGRTVYFGCENGELFALDTRNGRTRWSTYLGGAVKSAPALSKGILYVGDYGGKMNAVNARTGRVKWQSDSLGSGFGSGGAFYSTPAVAFGRVFAGNNDSRVYSYDVEDGTLAWSFSTGGYVYSGPAVTASKRTSPTVFIGSFDSNIYALNAKTGGVRWSKPVGGQVIGSLTVIGEIVYIAEFTNTTTFGFDVKSGRKVFRYKTGTYSPVISDGRRIYLTGYSSLQALDPVERKPGIKQLRPGARGAKQG